VADAAAVEAGLAALVAQIAVGAAAPVGLVPGAADAAAQAEQMARFGDHLGGSGTSTAAPTVPMALSKFGCKGTSCLVFERWAPQELVG
jgi:hypothetical protein